MLFSEYSTTYTTAFVEFNQRLSDAKQNYEKYNSLSKELILRDFVNSVFKLRKLYARFYEEDMHTDYLQPKVELIYDTIQHDFELVRTNDQDVRKEIQRLLDLMTKYTQKFF